MERSFDSHQPEEILTKIPRAHPFRVVAIFFKKKVLVMRGPTGVRLWQYDLWVQSGGSIGLGFLCHGTLLEPTHLGGLLPLGNPLTGFFEI